MNQILQMEKSKKNKKDKGPIGIGKIVTFFAVVIIIFAVVLIVLGSYALIKQNKEQENIGNTPVVEEQSPNVDIRKEEDNIVIDVNHTKPLSQIIYKWNEEDENVINLNGKTTLSETLPLPIGTNTLTLKVITSEGKETTYQKEYVVDGEGKPVIELKLTTENKIKIKVQDTSNLAYILYKWNDEEEQRVDAKEETKTLIEHDVEIPMGQNTLKVQAVNTNNVSTTKELEVKGIKSPTLSFKKEGNYLVIKAEDTVAIKVLKFTLNGQKYQINYGDKTTIEYKQLLQQGDNELEVTVENQDGGISTKKVVCKN